MSAPHGPDHPAENLAIGPAQFEFGAAENRVFEDLAAKLRFVGVTTTLIGGLIGLYGLFGLLATLHRGVAAAPLLVVLGAGLLIGVIGLWTRRAGVEFRLVAETTGKDITHVMGALENIHRLYVAQYWILLAALGFFVLVIVFGLMARPAL
ncbi:MAG TPA: hypothetical protein VF590_15430 [Isosphaeraceae bacterium]|jgi:hypothetical protein